ncbi:DNA methyltransferase [Roseiarcus fermentans]|uniref:DNA methyltransferase n=1 Tax=Roseiarcus fermentans TaxID=1473586 RepID=UPI001FDF0CBE|nr:DNA methyltransferase [Roseiarcus fermentans]
MRAKIPLPGAAELEGEGALDASPWLKPHQNDAEHWLYKGKRRALFASFGLGKTRVQLRLIHRIVKRFGGRGLIVIPLGVRQEFTRDAAIMGIPVTFIRRIEEAAGDGVFLTNYETVRDGKLDPALFVAASLDEASVLRGFGGTKTFREFMRLFEPVRFRFVATATPSPNDYIELLSYAAFLGVMDVGQAKTRFFKRDSTNADKLTLHPHKAEEFWFWVSSWALFIQRPSDLGHSDEGYALPELRVHYHTVRTDLVGKVADRGGQTMMFPDHAAGLVGAAREKRDTLPARIAKMREILDAEPDEHFLIWHDLEDERRAIERAVPGVVSVYGSQDLEERERRILDFSDGKIARLSTKPVIAGSGCNFQRHCAKSIFLGIGFKFNDFIQALHRIYRFLQTREVEIHIIYAESEQAILRTLLRKWDQHKAMVAKMSDIIREYGLSHAAMAKALERSIGCKRIEVSAEKYRLVNADCVEETSGMEANSVGLIVSSIPFSTQYEYSPSYNDFGHTDDDRHFWAQMDYLVPQLFRVLKPGRDAAIHVKDRIIPGGVSGLGFQTLSTFSYDCIAAFRKHGFAYLGEKTITTDVVRENNQTYRLGWTEQCKDGSRMGFGVPEKLLLFRKPPSSRDNGYADDPVRKLKKWYIDPVSEHVDEETGETIPASPGYWDNPDGYSRARWQIDAHAYTRSSGDRLITADELVGFEAADVFKRWKAFALETVYNFEHHVAICEAFEERGRLPSDFMLMPPHSRHPDVWTDITRMLSANTLQSQRGAELHLCPLQFDIVDRAINQWSNPGDVVFDPFGGLMTVPMRAVRFGRVGWGVELNHRYFLDGCAYVEAEARKIDVPTLFDALKAEAAGRVADAIVGQGAARIAAE